ncbi:MAG: winged helix-turn-helix domain-containing protein [Pseudomonadota bacterium]
MARKAGGVEQIESAKELLRTAKTADELRTAQAVLLPLELGLSLEQTAKAIGRSVGATCNLRTRYCKVARREREAPRSKRALRNRANATLEREAQILDEVLAGAMRGGVIVVPPLKDKIAERLGKPVALSTIYRMLARNGWRKLAPDTAHPQGDAAAREDWKKNSRGSWIKS